MKVKIETIVALAEILAGLKVSRIPGPDSRRTLLEDYATLRRVVKTAEADKAELVSKFQTDWADEIPAVESFRREGKPVAGHAEYLEAEKDANKAIQALFSQEVEVCLIPVKLSALDGIQDLTLNQSALLMENGIVEL